MWTRVSYLEAHQDGTSDRYTTPPRQRQRVVPPGAPKKKIKRKHIMFRRLDSDKMEGF